MKHVSLTKSSIALGTGLVFLGMMLIAHASELTGGLSSGGVVPVTPSSVSASQTGDTEITITWSAVAGVEGFRVYRIQDGTDPVLIANNLAGLAYVDSDLVDGVYAYQIQSFLGNLQSSLDVIPTAPITISTVTSSPTSPSPTPPPSGGGGGGGARGRITLGGVAQRIDVNSDSKINVLDFTALMIHWSSTDAGNIADFNDDDVVDVLDFTLLMIHWTG